MMPPRRPSPSQRSSRRASRAIRSAAGSVATAFVSCRSRSCAALPRTLDCASRCSRATTRWDSSGPAANARSCSRSSPERRYSSGDDRPSHAPTGTTGMGPAAEARGIVRRMPPSDQTRLLIVEDVPQVAQYIRGLLNSQARVKLLAVLGDGSKAIETIKELRPDIVLVDGLLQGRIKGPKLVEIIHEAE